jgi:hypothetical protein
MAVCPQGTSMNMGPRIPLARGRRLCAVATRVAERGEPWSRKPSQGMEVDIVEDFDKGANQILLRR